MTDNPEDGAVVNWNGTKEILSEQVFAIQFTTVNSKWMTFSMLRDRKKIESIVLYYQKYKQLQFFSSICSF